MFPEVFDLHKFALNTSIVLAKALRNEDYEQRLYSTRLGEVVNKINILDMNGV